MDANQFDDEYAEDLRNIVRNWRITQHRKLTRKMQRDRIEPTMADPVSDNLIRCAWVLIHAYSGAHHVGTAKIGSGDTWIEVVHYDEMATTDSDLMTRLVVLAHDAAVRVSVQPCGPLNLRIMLHPRARTDRNMTNHRTLENAADVHRRRWALVPVVIPVASSV